MVYSPSRLAIRRLGCGGTVNSPNIETPWSAINLNAHARFSLTYQYFKSNSFLLTLLKHACYEISYDQCGVTTNMLWRSIWSRNGCDSCVHLKYYIHFNVLCLMLTIHIENVDPWLFTLYFISRDHWLTLTGIQKKVTNVVFVDHWRLAYTFKGKKVEVNEWLNAFVT